MGDQSKSAAKETGGGEAQPSVRCLIVAPRAGDGEYEIPDDLLRSLRKHDVTVDRRPGVFSAIAAMIDHEKLRKRREATEGMALVVVDPERVARADELVGASERYAPSVVCWRYDSHTRLKLHAYQVTPSKEEPESAKPSRSDSAWSGSDAPRLRLTSEDELDGDFEPALDEREASRYGTAVGADATQLLTEDELSMLLGDDPYDGPPYPGQ